MARRASTDDARSSRVPGLPRDTSSRSRVAMMPAGRLDPGPDWRGRMGDALELTHEDGLLVPGPHTDYGPDARPERDNQFGASTFTGEPTNRAVWRGMTAYAGLDGTDRRWFREETPDGAWRRLQAAARRTAGRAARPDRACGDCGAVIPGTARRDKTRCERCQAASRQTNRRARSGPRPGQGARTDLASTSVTVYSAPPKGRTTTHNDSPALVQAPGSAFAGGSPNRQPGTPQPTNRPRSTETAWSFGEACPQ
jgi:hypothetical protein